MSRLAPKTKVAACNASGWMSWFTLINHAAFIQVLRDGQWQELDASILVPGDIISIKLGDIVPADARLLEGDPLKIDQAIRLQPTVFVQKR